MKDPYTILGIQKNASEADIKSAYRKLAKKYHPDINKGDATSQKRFSEATNAYDFLSDKTKRSQFDRGEIDADGNPRFQGFNRRGAGAHGSGNPFGGGFNTRGFGGMDPDDILSQIFGGGGRAGGFSQTQQRSRAHSQNPSHQAENKKCELTLNVPIEIAVSGGHVEAEISPRRQIRVKVPKDVSEGQQIRVKDGTEEIYFKIHIQAKAPYFFEGDRLFRRVPITLYEAILGGSIEVETPIGQVSIKLQAGTTGDKALRLKDRGLLQKGKAQRGDLFILPQIILPEKNMDELRTLMEFWQKNKAYNPRENTQ